MMSTEIFGNGNEKESYYDSLFGLKEEVLLGQKEKGKEIPPDKIIESLLSKAIENNQGETEARFIKVLTKEQREIVLTEIQGFVETIWGKLRETDELRITADETHMYIRIRQDLSLKWDDIKALKVSFPKVPKPKKPTTRKEEAELLTNESKESIEKYLPGEIEKAWEYNANISEGFREYEKNEHNRLYPLFEEISSEDRDVIFPKMKDLWADFSYWGIFDPEKYKIEITMDYPQKKYLYVRMRDVKTGEVVGRGAKIIERTR